MLLIIRVGGRRAVQVVCVVDTSGYDALSFAVWWLGEDGAEEEEKEEEEREERVGLHCIFFREEFCTATARTREENCKISRCWRLALLGI